MADITNLRLGKIILQLVKCLSIRVCIEPRSFAELLLVPLAKGGKRA